MSLPSLTRNVCSFNWFACTLILIFFNTNPDVKAIFNPLLFSKEQIATFDRLALKGVIRNTI